MSRQYVVTQRSWWLKLDRAELHLRHLERAVTTYTNGHHYRAIRLAPVKKDPYRWRFALEVTKEPNARTAVVLGDFLFNVRSALDHLAVQIAPTARESKAGFPIYRDPIFSPDALGVLEPLHEVKREKFASLTTEMPVGAQAIIEHAQPYRRAELLNAGPDAIHTLEALSRLHNADKHRTLSILATGVSYPSVTISWPGGQITYFSPRYLEKGAILTSWQDVGNRLHNDEVEVNVMATPHVAAVVGGQNAYELLPVCNGVIASTRRLLHELEVFARP